MFGFMHGEGLEIRREFLLEDAFNKIYHRREEIKDRLRIVFIDENFMQEEGIDGGGLTKEFLTKLTERIFDPHYGFFTETPVDHRLYPNYLSSINNHNYLDLFRFFGMIVGKAIYEGILLKCSFARFFLNRFAENPGTITGGSRNSIDDLNSLDPDLYKNLMMLKYYDGNAEDLGLTFAIEEDYMGTMRTLLLVPNGQNEPVTK
jgi:ubiquitin-protein ligase E3 C